DPDIVRCRAICRIAFSALLLSYGPLKFEGVLHIVVRSRYERDLDHPQCTCRRYSIGAGPSGADGGAAAVGHALPHPWQLARAQPGLGDRYLVGPYPLPSGSSAESRGAVGGETAPHPA